MQPLGCRLARGHGQPHHGQLESLARLRSGGAAADKVDRRVGDERDVPPLRRLQLSCPPQRDLDVLDLDVPHGRSLAQRFEKRGVAAVRDRLGHGLAIGLGRITVDLKADARRQRAGRGAGLQLGAERLGCGLRA